MISVLLLEDSTNSDYNPLALRLSSKSGVLHSPCLTKTSATGTVDTELNTAVLVTGGS